MRAPDLDRYNELTIHQEIAAKKVCVCVGGGGGGGGGGIVSCTNGPMFTNENALT